MMVSSKGRWIILAFVLNSLSSCKSLKIAVIGAGASGLAAAKNAIEQGHIVDVFEKTGQLGGIWYYTDDVGFDEYDVEIHTPMYKQLSATTPCEWMEFPGFDFQCETETHPDRESVWNYLHAYATYYNITNRLFLHRKVENVRLMSNGEWEVFVKNMPDNKQLEKHTYDHIFICSGVASNPRIPTFRDLNLFEGLKIHSRFYREPETFRGKNVLIIGSGASSLDITRQLKGVARKVVKSTHSTIAPTASPGSIIIFKGEVRRFGKNAVKFKDGSWEKISVVIFATGYLFDYPFLDSTNSGIVTNGVYVAPLYRQILNIENPTMAFVGIPTCVRQNPMYDLQARFALKFWTGVKQLPSIDHMMEDANRVANRNHPHKLGLYQAQYFDELDI
ncbi:dimethylaniline monooxygenase [N-oxide-forming] 3-like [Contarinia nasturtii]|uniref:dimethylaniline monooxygenase [N-oxide-forming] 3-like n=1 Tax=Contarinia nasturtii TaxID=265458 RepID=UPI0012D4436C|nr:dimethylaniline monooxygenase [N-oxide-forming] 3-like [Contarinia nasturtii]XP_031634183.1 dimethylaniline monooxygenase [N-oxide-forming] 3-like [Contarinia nasturtii]XP_031634185.1 dimethylaniline monooxygenase [N-oxide-forming] 3-like [Contarinia nasturtii]XP_031634186.1 dimethylaniline monooxygenase [N-oxide-forming] 3-like [Contarinia nasturtii]XP_031634187.1 dimethylaniline monooxygenase [N-oxide-forming] 3-like [Contarinia nasturtii]XP_031634188.1 dimethylaniline monooxygenase [N-ox